MAIEIGDEAVESLRFLSSCDSGQVEALASAVVAVLSSTQREDEVLDVPVLEALEVDLIKRLYSALACLFAEASKLDASAITLTTFLSGKCGVPEAQAEVAARVFATGKEQLRAELARTANFSSIDRLSGVDWRLQHRVSDDGTRDLVYHVELKTSGEPVTFMCTVEQLQDLVYSLKDACKAVERSAHQADRP